MRRTVTAFVIVFGVFMTSTLAGLLTVYTAHSAEKSDTSPWSIIARAFFEVETRYVKPIGKDTLKTHALTGMVSALDPHSAYFTAEEWASFRDQESRSYFGIGVELVSEETGLRVVGVVPQGPAERAGVKLKDLIVHIDGESTVGATGEQASEGLRGEPGTNVLLGIQRGTTPVSITVARSRVRIPAVHSERVDGDVGYLAIGHFREHTALDFAQHIERLEAQDDAPLRALLIDLRDNPGGHLEEAVALLDQLLGAGDLVHTDGRGPGAVERFTSVDDQDDRTEEILVLVNGASASAAEIVAGVLQQRGRAKLIGTQTYGKGSVQNAIELEDGSALKLTVARYGLPNGAFIEPRVGLTPDDIVPSPTEQQFADAVASLQAHLKELEGLTQADRTKLQNALEQQRTHVGHAASLPLNPPSVLERAQTDPQLTAALRKLKVQGIE